MRAFALSRTEAGIRQRAAQRGYAYREPAEPRQPENAPVPPLRPAIVLPEGDRWGRHWTPAENRVLLRMIGERKTASQIAKCLGRSKDAVFRRMRRDRMVHGLRIGSVESNVVEFRGPREIRRIIDLVARMHGETFASVMAPVRFRGPVLARQAAMCAVKEGRPNISIAQIGRIFRRDHTTVLHAMQKRGMTAQQEPKA